MKKVTKKNAAEKLAELHELQTKLKALREKHGIDTLENEIDQHKRSIVEYAERSNLLTIPGNGIYGRLMRQSVERRVLATDEEKDTLVATQPVTEEREYKSLAQIIEDRYGDITVKGKARRLWMKCTRRVIDMEGLEEAISSGLLSIEEITPAYYERVSAPYIRVFKDGAAARG